MRIRTPWIEALKKKREEDQKPTQPSETPATLPDRGLRPKKMSDSFTRIVRMMRRTISHRPATILYKNCLLLSSVLQHMLTAPFQMLQSMSDAMPESQSVQLTDIALDTSSGPGSMVIGQLSKCLWSHQVGSPRAFILGTQLMRNYRLGTLFMDLDALSGIVAYKHTGESVTTVTAAVDRITINHPLEEICDLELSGQVTYATGRSSMEISLQVAKASAKNQVVKKEDVLLTCAFTMVSLDPSTKKSVQLPSSPGMF